MLHRSSNIRTIRQKPLIRRKGKKLFYGQEDYKERNDALVKAVYQFIKFTKGDLHQPPDGVKNGMDLIKFTPIYSRLCGVATGYRRTSVPYWTLQPMTCDNTEMDSFVVYVYVGGKAILYPRQYSIHVRRAKRYWGCLCTHGKIRPESGKKLLECGVVADA